MAVGEYPSDKRHDTLVASNMCKIILIEVAPPSCHFGIISLQLASFFSF